MRCIKHAPLSKATITGKDVKVRVKAKKVTKCLNTCSCCRNCIILGWQCVKDEASGLESWYSQGVLYSNFTKRGKAIHIEYGDEGNVFGEEIES